MSAEVARLVSCPGTFSIDMALSFVHPTLSYENQITESSRALAEAAKANVTNAIRVIKLTELAGLRTEIMKAVTR